MKYHPTPPVELVLSIVTDNEPIPSKAYKHLGFLQYFTALTKAAALWRAALPECEKYF